MAELADIQQALNLLADLGGARVVHRVFGTVELTVDLPELRAAIARL